MPQSSSACFACFDHNPSDTELTCLLEGDSGWAGLKIVETDGLLRVRPSFIPTTGIMLSMVLGAVVISCPIVYFLAGEEWLAGRIVLWFLLASFWLLIPFWWIVLVVINRMIAAKEDVLRVDTMRRTLELCETHRTLQAAEILAFTEVSRYYRQYRHGGEWLVRFQTGMLVRTAHAQTELHALIDGRTNPPLADRLADIFHVSVRRITLDKAESRALNDC